MKCLRQEIQRAEQAAHQQEQREREALAPEKQEEEKRTSKPYQPTDQERKLINSTSGLGTAARQYSRPVSGPTLYSLGSIQAGHYVGRHGYRLHQRVPRKSYCKWSCHSSGSS